MITNADYMQIVSEAYDLSDPYIKKKVIFCNEAKRQENIENIVSLLKEKTGWNMQKIYRKTTRA